MKKFLVPFGIVTIMFFMVFATQKAFASPDNNPMFPTFEKVQQMISEAIAPLQTAINSLGQRVSLVETALTSNSQEIQNLNDRVTNVENNMPTPQPTPPFAMDIIANETGVTVSGSDVRISMITSSPQQRLLSGAVWHQPLERSQGWGILHTPEGDVNSGVVYEALGSNSERAALFFKMNNSYPGYATTADLYAFYGGKVATYTIPLTL